VAQDEGLEFKPQYRQKKKEKKIGFRSSPLQMSALRGGLLSVGKAKLTPLQAIISSEVYLDKFSFSFQACFSKYIQWYVFQVNHPDFVFNHDINLY
jgi:hypothetical protein